MKHQEKLGNPVIKDPENGADKELGQPIIEEEFEKESVEATLVAVKEALEEFYRRRSSREEQTAFILQVMRDPMRPFMVSEKEIKKEDGDVTIPLAILEAVRGEIQYEYDTMNSLELDAENQSENEKIETLRQDDFEKELHYQEASDVLFSHADYERPTHDDLLKRLSETKGYIRKLAKEEEKKYKGAEEGGVERIFRSRLLTDVPAIERYEIGRHTTRDYREIMDAINASLLGYRDRIGDVLLQYAHDPQETFVSDIRQSLKETRGLELILSQLEGERNERVAKKQS
ncbi:MAG: hypothetical protein Q7K16_01060 [Candidatus Azambacteria bacterium]|nr:hypothetical protein [Candidatus Azambacteria bacterium]